MRLPEARKESKIGDRFQITPGIDLQLANKGPNDCEILLLQGTGVYDWISCLHSK
jgi:hypothetical protein